MNRALFKSSVFGAAAFALMALSSAASAQEVGACLITKTDTNPFFVKMKEGATAKAAELGVALKSYAGKVDGDHDSQVAAIESCIADGAKGILIAASDTKSIVDQVKKAQEAGLLVIGATSQQYPLLMAALGIEAIAQFAKDGTKPKPTEGKDFFDTGVNLVTDKPADGVKSIDTKEGTDKCWG